MLMRLPGVGLVMMTLVNQQQNYVEGNRGMQGSKVVVSWRTGCADMGFPIPAQQAGHNLCKKDQSGK